MRKTMADTRVGAKILKKDECIFETVAGNPKDNDLKELIMTLKETQQKVNEFLTTLVHEQQNDLTKGGDFDDLESGSEEDSIEEPNRDNPKKCKFTV